MKGQCGPFLVKGENESRLKKPVFIQRAEIQRFDMTKRTTRMTDQVIERDRTPEIWQFRNVFLNGITAPEFALFFQQKNTGCRELFGYRADVKLGIGLNWLFQFEVREACLVFVHDLALFNQAYGEAWRIWAQAFCGEE